MSLIFKNKPVTVQHFMPSDIAGPNFETCNLFYAKFSVQQDKESIFSPFWNIQLNHFVSFNTPHSTCVANNIEV